MLLRGDTDFSLTANFDRWHDDGARFVFGYEAKAYFFYITNDPQLSPWLGCLFRLADNLGWRLSTLPGAGHDYVDARQAI